MRLEQKDLARRLLADDKTVLRDMEDVVWPIVRWRIERQYPRRFGVEGMRDLLQETLWTLWQKRANYDESKGSVASWFVGIALNKAKELARCGWMRQRRHERGFELVEGFDLLDTQLAERAFESTEEDDGEPCRESSRVIKLHNCLEQMGPRRREILFACRACDGDPPTSRELAEHFGTTPEVIRQELHRAIDQVREFFAKASG